MISLCYRLKRDMLVRLAQLAHDHEQALDAKMSKQAKRMLRENVSATEQLTTLSDRTTQLLTDNELARRSEAQLRLRLDVMESLERQWAKKLRTNARVPARTSLGPFYGSPLSRVVVVVVVVVDIDFTVPFTRCRYCRTPPAL